MKDANKEEKKEEEKNPFAPTRFFRDVDEEDPEE